MNFNGIDSLSLSTLLAWETECIYQQIDAEFEWHRFFQNQYVPEVDLRDLASNLTGTSELKEYIYIYTAVLEIFPQFTIPLLPLSFC